MLYNHLSTEKNFYIRSSNFNQHVNCKHSDRILDMHDLIFIREGEWCIAQDDIPYTIAAGDVIFLQKGHHHYGVTPCKSMVKTIYVEFDGCDGNVLSNKEHTPSSSYLFPVVTHCQNNPLVRKYFEQVVSHFWSDSWYEKAKASAYLDLLLCELSSIWCKENPLVDNIKKIITKTPNRFISNEEFAELYHCSVRTISSKFKESTGETLHAWQLKTKCQMARDLMSQDPTITLRELAAIYGFCDEYHFSKCYKKVFGYSPKRSQ